MLFNAEFLREETGSLGKVGKRGKVGEKPAERRFVFFRLRLELEKLII